MALPRTLEGTDLLKFRTRICLRWVNTGACNFGDKCQYSHNINWPRRALWEIYYSEELCEYVEKGLECPSMRYCKKAHTYTEQKFHPNVYKSVICNDLQKNEVCNKYYCPFAHSASELNTTKIGELAVINNKKIDFENQVLSYQNVFNKGAYNIDVVKKEYKVMPNIVTHPSLSINIVPCLELMFNEQKNNVLFDFALIPAWKQCYEINKALYMSEISKNVNITIWNKYTNYGSILAYLAPERIAYWYGVIIGAQKIEVLDDMKCLTWTACILLYIAQYGVHPFSESRNISLYSLRNGRADASIPLQNLWPTVKNMYSSKPLYPCNKLLSKGLEAYPEERLTWKEITEQALKLNYDKETPPIENSTTAETSDCGHTCDFFNTSKNEIWTLYLEEEINNYLCNRINRTKPNIIQQNMKYKAGKDVF